MINSKGQKAEDKRLLRRRCWRNAIITALFCIYVSINASAAPSGEEVYKQHCARCHDQAGTRIPPREVLQQMPATRILRSLDFGLMMVIAYPLHRDEREAVANFLGRPGREPGPPASAFCGAGLKPLAGAAGSDWNGWSPSTANTRFQAAQQAGLTAAQVSGLKLKWAYGFAGDVAAMAAPTVINSTLFVGSAGGTVQALDARTGCIHWVFQANGPVRAAPLAVRDGSRTALLFGDLIGWFYALDARTGKLLWKRKPEAHEATRLTASPVALNGIVYVPAASWEESRALDPQYNCCTFRGSLTAMRVRNGAVVWKTYMGNEPSRTGTNRAGALQYGPSGAGVWSAPTLDIKRGVMYVTTGDNYSTPATTTSDAVVALEIKSGRIVWTQQTLPGDIYTSACPTKGANCPAESGPDYDFGSSAMLLRNSAGHDVLIAGQKSGMVYALDPEDKGKILWQTRVGKGGTYGGVQWGMASDGEKIYAATSDGVRVQGGTSTTAAPIGSAIFDPNQGGGLTALQMADGAKGWFVPGFHCDPPRPGCSPAQSAALTAISGVVFSGSLDGHLRAFDTVDGHVIWDYDTAKEFTTVNGVQTELPPPLFK